MKFKNFPSKTFIETHAKKIPEINPPAVLAMLQVLQAASKIKHSIVDVLEEKYQFSEGKLRVMVVLYQAEGCSPSMLATQAGVSRGTISVMLRRMERDGLVYSESDNEDGRGKKIFLAKAGKKMLDDILPAHYLRITKLMGKLSVEEQNTLFQLLEKIVSA